MAEEQQQKTKKRKFVIPIVIILAILIGGYLISESRFQSTDDTYVEADIIQVTPKVAGHIVDIYIEDNKEIIKSEYLCYFKLDDKLILETGERRGTPVALVKRENEQVKEYIIAFNYEITDNKVQWGYGYYYDQNIEKAKADFERVKAGESLADTFDVKNNETAKKDIMKSPEKKIKNKNRDVR